MLYTNCVCACVRAGPLFLLLAQVVDDPWDVAASPTAAAGGCLDAAWVSARGLAAGHGQPRRFRLCLLRLGASVPGPASA